MNYAISQIFQFCNVVLFLKLSFFVTFVVFYINICFVFYDESIQAVQQYLIAQAHYLCCNLRSSHRRCSLKKVFLKIFQFHRKASVLKSLLTYNFGLQTQVFFCKFFKIFKNTFFFRTPPVATFVPYVLSLLLLVIVSESLTCFPKLSILTYLHLTFHLICW